MESYKNDVMVSVMCITYNHVNTIRDTLEGIVMQKTDFAYDVFIYDDASIDGTSDIVREYVQKYPDIFNAIISKKNIWRDPQRNEILYDMKDKYLTGKYVAICEGDDFWIDCNKLQIQVDYMEQHPECVMYLHNALWLNCEEGTIKAMNPFGGIEAREVSAEELITQCNGVVPTASLLYRKELESNPKFVRDAPVGDYNMLLYALACGKLYYSNRIMSVYRYLGQGSFSKNVKSDFELRFFFSVGMIRFLYEYDRYTKCIYHKWCEIMIQIQAVSVIHNAPKDTSMKDNLYRCIAQGYFLPQNSMDFVEKLEVLRHQWYDEQYVGDKVKNFIEHYDHIFIMGTGKCASMLAAQLENNQINYEGFVMTQKDKDLYLGKPVCSLIEIPQYTSLGILVGIDPTGHKRRDELIGALKEAKIKNYYFPFGFDDIMAESVE